MRHYRVFADPVTIAHFSYDTVKNSDCISCCFTCIELVAIYKKCLTHVSFIWHDLPLNGELNDPYQNSIGHTVKKLSTIF